MASWRRKRSSSGGSGAASGRSGSTWRRAGTSWARAGAPNPRSARSASASAGRATASRAAAKGAYGRHPLALEAVAPEDLAAVLPDLLGQLFGQAGLADAGLARHQDEVAFALHRLGPAPGEPEQLFLPAHEGHPGQLGKATLGVRADGEGARRGRGRSGAAIPARDVQVGVVAEHRRLQLAQRRAGFEPQFVDQQGPEPLIGVEGVGLAARPVQGDDELGPQALPEGMQADQGLQLTDEFAVAAQCQFRFRPAVGGHQAQLFEPGRLGACERLVAEVGEHGAAPEARASASNFDASATRPASKAEPPSATSNSNRPASVCRGCAARR